MTAMPAIGRAPCVNIDAEQELLGAILLNNRVLDVVGTGLRPEHFSHEAHRQIYTACTTLHSRGELATAVTIKDYFQSQEMLHQIGGPSYLARLAASATTVVNAPDYARVVIDLYQRRELSALNSELSARALSPSVHETAQQLLEEGESRIRALANDGISEAIRLRAIGKAVADVLARHERIRSGKNPAAISTGFPDLDRQLGGGLYPGNLYLLAGRPSMGKSALGLAMAENVAKNNISAAFFSLEMSAEMLAMRSMGAAAGLPYVSIMRAELSTHQEMALVNARAALDALPLHICDKSAMTVQAMRSELLRTGRAKAVFVDYLQLVHSADKWQGNKVQQVAEVSGALKALAKDLNVPVVALSQLSRAVESRDKKRPQLSDLRESGAIEQDADAVMFVYREEYYLEREKREPMDSDYSEWRRKLDEAKNRMEVLVQKNRMGPIGDVDLYFEAATSRFGNWAGR